MTTKWISQIFSGISDTAKKPAQPAGGTATPKPAAKPAGAIPPAAVPLSAAPAAAPPPAAPPSNQPAPANTQANNGGFDPNDPLGIGAEGGTDGGFDPNDPLGIGAGGGTDGGFDPNDPLGIGSAPAQQAPASGQSSAAAPASQPAAAASKDDNGIDWSQVDLNKYVVILLYGKNSFGDKVYSYLKITLGGIEKLKAAVLVGMSFNPSDFGSIIAAGKGEPTDEVRAEIASMYHVLTAQAEAPQKAVQVSEKKAWDEY